MGLEYLLTFTIYLNHPHTLGRYASPMDASWKMMNFLGTLWTNPLCKIDSVSRMRSLFDIGYICIYRYISIYLQSGPLPVISGVIHNPYKWHCIIG